MALLSFIETDAAADDGFDTGCSGLSAGATTFAHEMTQGGTPGVIERVPTQTANKTIEGWLALQTQPGEPGVSNWGQGDYGVPFRVTTADMNTRWRQVWICERESGGTFDVVTFSVGVFDQHLGNVGVYGEVVNDPGPDFSGNSASTLYIMLGFFWNSTMGTSSAGITFDQTITTPIDDGLGAGARRRPMLVSRVFRRFRPEPGHWVPPWMERRGRLWLPKMENGLMREIGG